MNQPDSDDSKKKNSRVGNKSDTILLLRAYDHCILFLEDPKLFEKHRLTSQQVMPSHVCSSLEKHSSQKEHNEMFPKRKWLSTQRQDQPQSQLLPLSDLMRNQMRLRMLTERREDERNLQLLQHKPTLAGGEDNQPRRTNEKAEKDLTKWGGVGNSKKSLVGQNGRKKEKEFFSFSKQNNIYVI